MFSNKTNRRVKPAPMGRQAAKATQNPSERIQKFQRFLENSGITTQKSVKTTEKNIIWLD